MRPLLRSVLITALLTISASAGAFTSYRAGNKVLNEGDPVGKLMDSMGQPEWREAVVNDYGAQLAENWFYRIGSKTVKFQVSGGRIIFIEEIR